MKSDVYFNSTRQNQQLWTYDFDFQLLTYDSRLLTFDL